MRTLSSNGYRFPPFQFSLLSTAIVSIKENSLLSSSTTVSTLRLVIGHRVVPIGTSQLWLLRVRTHQFSASVHLSLLVGERSGIVAAFCLHIIQVKPWARWCSLCSDREPLSWLRFLRRAITVVCFISRRPWGRGGQC